MANKLPNVGPNLPDVYKLGRPNSIQVRGERVRRMIGNPYALPGADSSLPPCDMVWTEPINDLTWQNTYGFQEFTNSAFNAVQTLIPGDIDGDTPGGTNYINMDISQDVAGNVHGFIPLSIVPCTENSVNTRLFTQSPRPIGPSTSSGGDISSGVSVTDAARLHSLQLSVRWQWTGGSANYRFELIQWINGVKQPVLATFTPVGQSYANLTSPHGVYLLVTEDTPGVFDIQGYIWATTFWSPIPAFGITGFNFPELSNEPLTPSIFLGHDPGSIPSVYDTLNIDGWAGGIGVAP